MRQGMMGADVQTSPAQEPMELEISATSRGLMTMLQLLIMTLSLFALRF